MANVFAKIITILLVAFMSILDGGATGSEQQGLPENIDFQLSQVIPNSIFEGDILLDKNLANRIKYSILSQHKHVRRKREISKELWRKWTKGVVPYTIEKGIDHRRRKLIKRAVRLFNKKTCISFIPRTNEKDYAAFISGIGCYSNIGRQGGRQEISLGQGCDTLPHVVHELMHTIGFLHEHSRYDRDKYVKVHWNNILPGKEVHFSTYPHEELDNLDAPYDIMSILHYGRRAFSKNGLPTVTAKNKPNVPLGGHTLSDIDVKQINWVYKCQNKRHLHCMDRHRHCRKVRKFPRYCIVLRVVMAQFCPASCHFC